MRFSLARSFKCMTVGTMLCPLCHILFSGLVEEISLEDLQIPAAASNLHSHFRMCTPNGSASPHRINHLCLRICNVNHSKKYALRLWVYHLAPSLLSFPSAPNIQYSLPILPSNQMIRQQKIRNPLLDLILMPTIPTHQTPLTNLRL